ncbi:alpha-L-rhamnosidase N-terminal domain-containing protein [Paenibacillus thermotolerans]|uniref:alpha-L-rhamnosidase-related protein n=1 Tax=Paenibacillus thermotolerans TaxID=3027807 RepID=UPI002368761E|nr:MULTISPECIES: alpha-L-rhamnosidase N-terminal domain-containing protein [unclassified Paenibacillus]
MNHLWNAKWIWVDLPEYTPNVYAEARTVFTIDTAVSAASLHISANQEYRVFINGEEAGRGPSPADNDWQYYDTYDAAEYLIEGNNCIAILAYNFGSKEIVTGQRQGPGGIIAQLDVRTEEGELCVGTDEAWKCRRSPRWVQSVSRMHLWNGFKEIYLAQREDGWECAGYDDSAWENAKIVCAAEQTGSPWPRLLAREIPFLHRERIRPSSIVRVEENFGSLQGERLFLADVDEDEAATTMTIDASVPGSLPGVVYDFTAVKVGYPEIVLDAPEGGVLQLFYGESLELTLLDTFVLGKGENRLTPFGRRAFRYLMLSVQATPAPIRIYDLSVTFVHYPFAAEGTFDSSDPLLNRIWDVGRYTTMVNSQDHLEDCPYREQALWVVDAVVMSKVIYHTFGDSALLRKCLLQGARIQNPDGSIPGTGPERNSFLLPDFNAYWFLGVYDYWRYSGDDRAITELWGPIQRLIRWFRDQEDENGLFSRADRPGWWCFVDWAEYIDKRDKVTAISCLHYKLLRKAAEVAGRIGETGFAIDCNQRADRLRESIRTNLRVPEKHVFADCLTEDGLSRQITYQTNFIAIWCGVMTEEEAEHFITQVFMKGQCPELKGAFFYHIVLEVLFERGYGEAALDIIRTYWGEMLARGATTWWETFDPSTPHCTIPSPFQGNTPTYLADHIPVSHCHGWGASPTYLLTQRVLGIDVSGLSERIVHLTPYTTNLEWAKGTVPTPYGPISAEWKRGGGSSVFTARLPRELQWKSDRLEQVMEVEQGDTVIVSGVMIEA